LGRDLGGNLGSNLGKNLGNNLGVYLGRKVDRILGRSDYFIYGDIWGKNGKFGRNNMACVFIVFFLNLRRRKVV